MYCVKVTQILFCRQRTVEESYARFYHAGNQYKQQCDPVVVSLFIKTKCNLVSAQSTSGGQLKLRHYIGPAMISACCLIIAAIAFCVEQCGAQLLPATRRQSLWSVMSDRVLA